MGKFELNNYKSNKMKLSFIPILLFSAFALTAQAMVGMNINEPREAVINVAPKIRKATIKRSNAKYTFPRYSYTVITLKK